MTATLFDAAAPAGEVVADPAFTGAHRLQLDARSWVDVVPGWLAGASRWFDEVSGSAPWVQRRRRMWEQDVVEPRLTCGWELGHAPAPSEQLAALLQGRYGVPFDRVSANLYRDGDDSVAWHGDRVRFTHAEPVVAIVSLGAARRFGLRPLVGSDLSRGTRWLTLCGGDLLVMGGRCQHEWQHTVPKERTGDARISMTFRHDDPGPAPRAARTVTAR